MSVALYAFLISLSGGCIFFAGMTGEEIAARKTKELRTRVQQVNELLEQKRQENNELYLTVKNLKKSLNEASSDIRPQLEQQRLQLISQCTKEIHSIVKDRDY